MSAFRFFRRALSRPSPGPKRETQEEHLKRLLMPQRELCMQPAAVAARMAIKPGTTIVDIGAGSGLFTFAFAESLKGTGRVFATDVNPFMTEHVAGRCRELGFGNVSPVLLTRKGPDPFYREHSFDTVFLANGYELIWRPVDYFKELRSSLKPLDGRLYILYLKTDPDFSAIEFGDFLTVMRTLTSRKENFPVITRLSAANRDFIAGWRGEEVPAGIKNALLSDFNGMLSGRSLFNDLIDYQAVEEGGFLGVSHRFLEHRDINLAHWLVARLEEDGAFGASTTEAALSARNKKQLRRLNRMCLEGVFKAKTLDDVFKANYQVYFSTDTIISQLEQAGYAFVRRHDLLDYHHFLEFKRTEPR